MKPLDDRTIDSLYQVVGRRLREARRRAGLPQRLVAERLGLTRCSMSNLEAGRQRMPLHRLYECAQQVGLPVAELFPAIEEFGVDRTEGTFETVLGHRLPIHQARFVRAVLAADEGDSA